MNKYWGFYLRVYSTMLKQRGSDFKLKNVDLHTWKNVDLQNSQVKLIYDDILLLTCTSSRLERLFEKILYLPETTETQDQHYERVMDVKKRALKRIRKNLSKFVMLWASGMKGDMWAELIPLYQWMTSTLCSGRFLLGMGIGLPFITILISSVQTPERYVNHPYGLSKVNQISALLDQGDLVTIWHLLIRAWAESYPYGPWHTQIVSKKSHNLSHISSWTKSHLDKGSGSYHWLTEYMHFWKNVHHGHLKRYGIHNITYIIKPTSKIHGEQTQCMNTQEEYKIIPLFVPIHNMTNHNSS